MQRVNELSADNLFHDVFVISALKGSHTGARWRSTYTIFPTGINTDSLLSFLRQRALPREWEYHSSVITTQTDRERAMEIIREQIFIRFNQEIPYVIKLVLRSWVDFPVRSPAASCQVTSLTLIEWRPRYRSGAPRCEELA